MVSLPLKDLTLETEEDMDIKYMRLKKGIWYLAKKVKGKWKGPSLKAREHELSLAMCNYAIEVDRLERGEDKTVGKQKVKSVPYTPKSERERGLWEGAKKTGEPHPLMVWFGNMKVRDVNDESILEYVASRDMTKSTIKKELRLLKNVIQEVNKKFELPEYDVKKKSKRVTRALTVEQVRKVLGHVRNQSQEFGAQYVQIFKIMMWSGMDSKDVVYLRWDYIEDNWIRASRFKTGNPFDVPVCKPLAALLKSMVRNLDGRLFHGITSKANCSAIARAFQDAGIKGSSKSLRHFYASMLESGGASLPQISQALGQSPGSKCTQVYIHALEEDLAKAVSVFERKVV